jgi:amino-acid N-acetyltransferase
MVKKAKMSHAKEIHTLINNYAKKGELLPLSLYNIFEHIRDFYIIEKDGQVVGCCALKPAWKDTGEIRSLAIKEEEQNKGLGEKLVKKALEDAKELGLKKVFCLTNKPTFFEKMGFKKVSKKSLPQKIWKDCVDCIKFPQCDEVALIYFIT